MTQTVNGLSWTRINRGVFMTNWFKYDIAAYVAGERGRWQWTIERRLPPTFSPALTVAHGSEANKITAMLTAQDAIGVAVTKIIAQEAA